MTNGQIRRRRVYYIPGYDPFHPRRYRELYRKEGIAQAGISGYALQLRSRQTTGRYGWGVDTTIAGLQVHTDIDVLVWSDLVRASMGTSIVATYLQLLRTASVYIGSGALFRLMRLRKGPMIAALYPIGMLLAQLAVAIAVTVVAALVAGPWMAGAGWPALVLIPLILRWFRGHDRRLFAYYLMHDYAYSARWSGANPPELEARMAEFGQTLAAALAEDLDEVLVVGHSSGAHIAVSVLSDLIRAGKVPPGGPALGFLSLGQVVPMVSFLPKAGRLRADLAYLSASADLTWVDVTAPGDGCAFALCDPVSVTGVAPEGKRWPLVISAAFTQSLSAQRWKELRWRFFRLHFQYLCAFDRPKDYDYFQITAGPLSLARRYAGRTASKSRIETAVNHHRSLAA